MIKKEKEEKLKQQDYMKHEKDAHENWLMGKREKERALREKYRETLRKQQVRLPSTTL